MVQINNILREQSFSRNNALFGSLVISSLIISPIIVIVSTVKKPIT